MLEPGRIYSGGWIGWLGLASLVLMTLAVWKACELVGNWIFGGG